MGYLIQWLNEGHQNLWSNRAKFKNFDDLSYLGALRSNNSTRSETQRELEYLRLWLNQRRNKDVVVGFRLSIISSTTFSPSVSKIDKLEYTILNILDFARESYFFFTERDLKLRLRTSTLYFLYRGCEVTKQNSKKCWRSVKFWYFDIE